MSNKPDLALAAIFETDEGAQDVLSKDLAVPSLEERVELYLRAVHTRKEDLSAAERKYARARILAAMAQDVTNEISLGALTDHEILSRDSTRTRTSTSALAGVLQFLRDTLLFPLMLPASGIARFAVASLFFAFAISSAWSAFWLYANHSAGQNLNAFLETESKSGRSYDCGSRSGGGFPLQIEITCVKPMAKIKLANAELSLNAKELKATASIFAPGTVAVEVVGPVSLVQKASQTEYIANWSLAHLKLNNEFSYPTRLKVAIHGAQAYRVSLGALEPLLIGERIELEVGRTSVERGPQTLQLAVLMERGSIPANDTIFAQPFKASLTGTMSNLAFDQPKNLVAQLKEWSDRDGHLNIEDLRIQNDSSIVTATGALALNQAGFVNGAFTASTVGDYATIAEDVASGNNSDSPRTQSALLDRLKPQTRSINSNDRPSAQGNSLSGNIAAGDKRKRPEKYDLQIRIEDGSVYFGSKLIGSIPSAF